MQSAAWQVGIGPPGLLTYRPAMPSQVYRTSNGKMSAKALTQSKRSLDRESNTNERNGQDCSCDEQDQPLDRRRLDAQRTVGRIRIKWMLITERPAKRHRRAHAR